jgi:hypothetical protein
MESLAMNFRLLSTTKRFQLQLLRQRYYQRQLGNNFKSTLAQEDLSFAIPKSTQLTFHVFKTSFQGWKHFKLLWRGSRDGFGAAELHRRCDGRANTLMFIADTDGNGKAGTRRTALRATIARNVSSLR